MLGNEDPYYQDNHSTIFPTLRQEVDWKGRQEDDGYYFADGMPYFNHIYTTSSVGKRDELWKFCATTIS